MAEAKSILAAPFRSRLPQSVMERGQLLLVLCLAALTIGAWAITVHQARTMDMPMGIALRAAADLADAGPAADSMDGMDMGGASTSGVESIASSGMAGMDGDNWSWSGFSTFIVAWVVMMAAMMFPAVAPLLLLLGKTSRQRGSGGIAPAWLFAGGYLVVWSLAGVATWALVRIGIDLGGRLGSGDRETWAPIALGATLVVAGMYQFSPLKAICLRQCQSPVGFLMSHWRSGPVGAVRMGIEHGVFCLGCCWALFAVLVAAGVMSLAWMLLLTLIVFTEKVLRPNAWTPRIVGATFLGLGLIVAAGAIEMPWAA
jgi:predicted metal-binding membrane protein